MIGIEELARRIGLSVGTVSRALNDHPSVSDRTRLRVRRAADELGYVPNQSGRSLRQGKTRMLGFAFKSSRETAANADNFFFELFEGVQEGALEHGMDLALFPCGRQASPESQIRKIVGRGLVDGLIISSTEPGDARIAFLNRIGFPFLALGRSEGLDGFDWIDLDFDSMARDAIGRFLALGHQRIGMILPDNDINYAVVLDRAFRQVLGKLGLAFDPSLVVRSQPSEQGGYAAAELLLDRPDPPTAILLVHELLAIGIYAWLAERGQQAGRDLSLIGLRDSPRTRLLAPGLASYRVDAVAIGRELAVQLVAAIAEPDRSVRAPLSLLWPMTFANSGSLGPRSA